MTSNRRSCRALLAASAAIAAAAIAPAAANAAVSVTVTGDDGNPLALGGTLNIRNMNPQLSFAALTTDHWGATVTGPAAWRSPARSICGTGPFSPKLVDYIGNGAYTVTVTNYSASCSAPVGSAAEPAVHHHGVHCRHVAPHRAADAQARARS